MSWFSCSKLRLGEVIILSHDIMNKVPSKAIDEEYKPRRLHLKQLVLILQGGGSEVYGKKL
jgi:hypothetical protein